MDVKKKKYRDLCESGADIPIFSQAWWLDATAGEENWSVALVEQSNRVVAAMPYTYKKRYGFLILSQPSLTQKLGPWFAGLEGREHARIGREIELMTELIEQLPRFDHFHQSWDHGMRNWLPFYWKGYRQTTRYTYVLPDLSDEKAIWDGFAGRCRTNIRKAIERSRLTIKPLEDIEILLRLNHKVFARQGMKRSYSDDYVRRIDEACRARNVRKMFLAEDAEGRAHAAAYIVWDKQTAYALLNGADPTLRGSGAGDLCTWEAIKFSASVARSFDFEGSMLAPVEPYMRQFGGTQKPYFHISKTPSRIVSTYLFMRDMHGR